MHGRINHTTSFKMGMTWASLKERHNEGTRVHKKSQGPEYRWGLTLKGQ